MGGNYTSSNKWIQIYKYRGKKIQKYNVLLIIFCQKKLLVIFKKGRGALAQPKHNVGLPMSSVVLQSTGLTSDTIISRTHVNLYTSVILTSILLKVVNCNKLEIIYSIYHFVLPWL